MLILAHRMTRFIVRTPNFFCFLFIQERWETVGELLGQAKYMSLMSSILEKT